MASLEELGKLVEAEYLVPEINARIDEQRQVVENLTTQGHDITSAKIVLDSLLMSFFCASKSVNDFEQEVPKTQMSKPHDRHALRAALSSIPQIQRTSSARGQCVSSYLSATVDKPRSLCAFCAPYLGAIAMVTMMRGLVTAYSFKVGNSNHIIADSAYDRADWR